jgi:glycosyltransferase involved in cell wall biosynthesis
MKILFLIPYSLKEAPSQRFRFEQYLTLLESKNLKINISPFLNSGNSNIFSKPGKHLSKTAAVLNGFTKRFFILFTVRSYQFVFIHREATPIGPPIIEWVLAKILRKRIIYDFDDSIWLTDKTNEGWMEKIIRCRSKVKYICRWSYKVSCGNQYLCDYAKKFNQNVLLNPTTIDTQTLHNPALYEKEDSDRIIIGWTGSHSTLKYLIPIVPVIQLLENKYPQIHLLVIANKKPELNIKSLLFIPWSLESEIENLNRIDIGIMPLPDDEWSKGKCGFKLLQYMALNKPALASPVGVNTEIINNTNGFLCNNLESWIIQLELLIKDNTLRKELGVAGRELVEKNYSVLSNRDNFLSLFE